MQMGSEFHALSGTAEDETYSQSLHKGTRAYVINHVFSYIVRHCVKMGRSSFFLVKNPSIPQNFTTTGRLRAAVPYCSVGDFI